MTQGPIIIRGVRRSGTTFLQHLIELNFGPGTTDTIGKHSVGPTHFVGPVLVVTKNPYAWLASFCRWARVKEPSERLDNELLENWVAKNLSWRDWPGHYFVRYEDLLLDPKKELFNIAHAFGHDWDKEVVPVPSRVSKDPEQPHVFDPDYYLKSQYMKELAGRETNIYNNLKRDWLRTVVEELGYQTQAPGWQP